MCSYLYDSIYPPMMCLDIDNIEYINCMKLHFCSYEVHVCELM